MDNNKKTVTIVFDVNMDEYDDVSTAKHCVELARDMIEGLADFPGVNVEGKLTISCEDVNEVLEYEY
jgi:hypothetical protein